MKRVHDNFNSLFYELKVSRKFAEKVGIYERKELIEDIARKLNKLDDENDQRKMLRQDHPTEFVASLNAMERNNEVDALYKKNDESNYTWEFFVSVIPYFQRQQAEGKLHDVSNVPIDDSRINYFGESSAKNLYSG